MALGSNTPRTHIRSITAIGAGAALFAVVGYLFLNKKKPKKKPKSSPEQLTNFQNMQAILASSKSFKGHRKSDDQVVPSNVSAQNNTEPCTSKDSEDYNSIDEIKSLNQTPVTSRSSEIDKKENDSICKPIEASSPLEDYKFFKKEVLNEKIEKIREADEPEVQEVTIKLNAEDEEVHETKPTTINMVKIEESKTKEWTIVEIKSPINESEKNEDSPIIIRQNSFKIEESKTKECTIIEVLPEKKKDAVIVEELAEVSECLANVVSIEESKEETIESNTSNVETHIEQTIEPEVIHDEPSSEVVQKTDNKEDLEEAKPEEEESKVSENKFIEVKPEINISQEKEETEKDKKVIEEIKVDKKEIDEIHNNNNNNNLEKSSSSSSTTSNSSAASTTLSSSSYSSSKNELEHITKENLNITKTNSNNSNSKRPTRSVPKSRAENDSVNKKSVDSSFKAKKSAKTISSSSSDAKANKDKEDDSNVAYEDLVVYEFNFPRKFCGKLIGKNGVHVDFIRSKTHTQIAVRNDPNLEDLQIVCVSGRVEDVDHALDIISGRFPAKLYPQISFKPISKPIVYRRHNLEKNSLFNESKVLVAPNMFVDIATVIPKNETGEPSGDFFEVYVSSVVSAAHVFIQLPSNVTYEHLQNLDQTMLTLYNDSTESVPLMVEPIEYGSICAAPTYYGWHRAMVVSYITKTEAEQQIPNYTEACGLATIKFLDYGGYLSVPTNQLRQLRSDFINLPFQAIECYLDGIYPYEGMEEEGKNFLSEMIKNSTLRAKITGYSEDGMPVVKLFSNNDTFQNLEINSELVNYGYAFYLNQFEKYQKEKINLDNQQQLTQAV